MRRWLAPLLTIGLLAGYLNAEGVDPYAPAPTVVESSPPHQNTGRWRVSGTVGWGTAFNQNYTILGLGAGYYWWRGLETGADFEGWFGNSPKIYKISPEARYVAREFPGPIKPYGGGFYRHTFYEDEADLDSVGARMGGILASKAGASLGGGVVYEHYMNCNERVYGSCDSWYPEITILFSF